MPRPIRLLALAALALAACRREPPAKATPPHLQPPGVGVHVAAAGGDSLHVRFTVTVTGAIKLGIQAPMFAMRPDSTLLLATPADLIVSNKAAGSVVIAAADSGVELAATLLDPLDTATTPPGHVRGHVVRFARPDGADRLILAAGTDTLTLSLAPREKRR